MPESPITSSATAPIAAVDLSHEIACTVDRVAGDEVRCTRVTESTYRCNWWAAEATAMYDNPSMVGLLVTTHRVRKSQYLRVSKTDGKLVIKPWVATTAIA